jgi:hypothetical protein
VAPAPAATAAPAPLSVRRARTRIRVGPEAGEALAATETTLPAGSRITGVDPQVLQDLRRVHGAKLAARRLGQGGKAGTEAVRAATGGPSRARIPFDKELRALDSRYRHLIDSEQGAAKLGPAFTYGTALAGALGGAALGDTPERRAGLATMLGLVGLGGAKAVLRFAQAEPVLAGRIFDAIQGYRVEALLSGTAAPKNVATAIGSPLIAAAEGTGRTTLAPIKEALRIPTNVREFVKGMRTPIDIGAETTTRRPRGPFGRLISGIDAQAMAALKRAGLSDYEIDRVLLRLPKEEFIGQAGAKILGSRPAQAIVPFQRTAINQYFGGMEDLGELGGKTLRATRAAPEGAPVSLRRRAVTAAAAPLGYATGQAVDRSGIPEPLKPLAFGLGGAFMGRRFLPFAAGGVLSPIRNQAAIGSTPFPEFGIDPRQWLPPVAPNDVALIRFLRQLQGQATR